MESPTDTQVEPEFIPNWVRLAKRYPDKIKSHQDAFRYIIHCLKKDAKKIVKTGLNDVTFIIGNNVIMLTKDGFKEGSSRDIKPPHIDGFK